MDDGEDRGLLEAEPPRRQRRPTWTAVAAAMLVAVLALPLLVLRAPEDQLAMALHPERHARPPTTLTFDWTVTLGTRAPDGVEKSVYLVNGRFPGPTIEARSGDRVVVRVANRLAEGIAIHWHGLRMRGRNRMDGAVGFTQCPIPPGETFVYDLGIGDDEHGTFWWHGHGQQRADGLYGGFVVHGPAAAAAAAADALVLVGDWFHRPQADVLGWYADHASLGREPVPDSLLVNGRGRYDCSLAVPARPVVCRQLGPADLAPLLRRRAPTRLRLVNAGSVAGFTVRAGGATLRPVAVDGGSAVDAAPGRSVGVLYPGERVDVMLTWDGAAPRMAIHLDDENFGGFPNPALDPNQTFRLLPGSDDGGPLEPGEHRDLSRLAAAAAAAAAQQTVVLYIKTQKLSRFGNRPLGFVNHTTWEPQTPPLLALDRSSWDAHQLVAHVSGAVDVVVNNLDDGPHAVHVHGHAVRVLASFRAAGRAGWGSYDAAAARVGPAPDGGPGPVKDTVSVPRRGHVVLRLTADNPGLWMLHCHMLVHMGTGMAAGLHVGEHRPDPAAAELCR